MVTSPIWHVVSALAVAGTLAVHGGPAHATPRHAPAGTLHFDDGGERYRGYRIEMARDVPNAEIGQLRQAAEHQVDIVEATSLDEGNKAFLRRFPVVVHSGPVSAAITAAATTSTSRSRTRRTTAPSCCTSPCTSTTSGGCRAAGIIRTS